VDAGFEPMCFGASYFPSQSALNQPPVACNSLSCTGGPPWPPLSALNNSTALEGAAREDRPYRLSFSVDREDTMPTPFESASLNLQLFDLRREPVLREARDWFLREFNPESFTELVTLLSGERNASFRMVIGYWDMAASLVTSGAIDGESFRSAHGEIFATFSKIQPFLAELRAVTGEPDICKHMEEVIFGAPMAEATLARRREALRAAAKARGSESRAQPTSELSERL